MTLRSKRVERLLDLADAAVRRARANAAAAEQAMNSARASAEQSEHLWDDAAQRFGSGVASGADLHDQAAHLRSLRQRADAALQGVATAVHQHDRALREAVAASRKHRQLELWRDRIRQAEQDEEHVQEQRTTDEIAARTARAR